MAKKKSIKRDIAEWVVFLGIIGVLYITGLHVPVFGFLQGLILKTGIIKPNLESEAKLPADYDFYLIDTNGKTLSFEQFKNETVFLNFWATWCPPCIAEMPDINNLYKEVSDQNVQFVMIAMDDDFQKAKDFLKRKNFDFPIYRLASTLPRVYESRAIPTTYVIGSDGLIHVKKSGMAKYNTREFRDILLRL
jgi:thiol-disulfide isomerase/thioredoxin